MSESREPSDQDLKPVSFPFNDDEQKTIRQAAKKVNAWLQDGGEAPRVSISLLGCVAIFVADESQSILAHPPQAMPCAPILSFEEVAGARIGGTVEFLPNLGPSLNVGGFVYAGPIEQPTTAQPVQVPEGWRLVPEEPTPEMLEAVLDLTLAMAEDDDEPCHREIFSAMLFAAPLPPAQPEPRVEFYTDEPVQSHSMSIADAARVLSAFFTEFPGGVEEMQAAQPVGREPLPVERDQFRRIIGVRAGGVLYPERVVRRIERAHGIGL